MKDGETVRDLWAGEDIEASGGRLEFTLAPHSVRLLKIKTERT